MDRKAKPADSFVILEEDLCDLWSSQEASLFAKFRRDIGLMVAYAILYQKKYIIDHSWDPPGDHSGLLWQSSESINICDYATVSEFCEQVNTGNSRPSFVSGCGMFHDTYTNELDLLARDLVTEVAKEIFENHIDHSAYTKENEIEELFFDFLGESDFLVEREFELKQSVMDWKLADLFSEFQDMARAKRLKEELLWEQQQKQAAQKERKARLILAHFLQILDLSATCKLEKGHPKWLAAKTWVERELSGEECHLLARVLNCSNSIQMWLTSRSHSHKPNSKKLYQWHIHYDC